VAVLALLDRTRRRREHVRVARNLPELPLVRQAFASGELSYCKVRAITRVATPEIEESLVELARHATGSQLDRLVRFYGHALAATTESARRIYERRSLTFRWDDDGSLRIEARLGPDEGALVLSALAATAEASSRSVTDSRSQTGSRSETDSGFQPGSAEAPEPADGPAARRADALVTIARSSLADSAAVLPDATPCELVVHVDTQSLGADRVHERCELAEGPAIAPETARRLGCDGSIVRIIERDGRPLSVGRRKRTVPAPLRRALRSRDDGCRFPGCGHKRFLHAHHIHHWARGGPTTLDNLIQLCSYHHRLVHEGGFCVEHAGRREVRFRRPDGRLIESTVRPSPCGPGLEQQHRSRGLAIDADTCRPRSLGDRLDYGIAVEGLLVRALAGT
jgi:Domain of unknown function (DUF222)/HNH endonuclease